MIRLIMIMLTLLIMSGCTVAKPGVGEEVVWVMKPWFFGHGGIDPTPVKTGRQYAAFSTEAWYVNVLPQQHSLHVENMMSSDGVPLSFDAVVRIRITDSVKMLSDFGSDYYNQNIEREFLNLLRQEVRKYGMNEMSISTAAVDAVDHAVLTALRNYVKKINMPLDIIAVTVGKIDPPDAVKTQRIETAQQEQRINTERKRKEAEDSRKQAEMSRASADNAYREAMHLNMDQFLNLEQIKMLREACGSESKTGCTFIFGGGATPVLKVGK